MAKSKMLDRMTISFYEEVDIEMVLLEALNKVTVPRMRGAKLKEWAYNYLRSNTELYTQVLKDLEDKRSNNTIAEKQISPSNQEQEKNKLKSKLNIITSED